MPLGVPYIWMYIDYTLYLHIIIGRFFSYIQNNILKLRRTLNDLIGSLLSKYFFNHENTYSYGTAVYWTLTFISLLKYYNFKA